MVGVVDCKADRWTEMLGKRESGGEMKWEKLTAAEDIDCIDKFLQDALPSWVR